MPLRLDCCPQYHVCLTHSCYDLAAVDIFGKLTILFHNLSVCRNIVIIRLNTKPYKFISGFLKFR